MFGKLIKKQNEAKKARFAGLIADTTRRMEDLMFGNIDRVDEVLRRLGVSYHEAYETVNADDEVEACKEDLRMAMTAAAWRIYGEGLGEEDNDRLYRMVRRHLPSFVDLVITAKLYGFAVARYVYEVQADGFIAIRQVLDRRDELYDYRPLSDGRLLYLGNGFEEEINTDVQHLLIRNRPTARHPRGEMTAARIYPAIAVRNNGWLYANQFIIRYGQPYLVGKIDGTQTEAEDFVGKLYQFVKGGAQTINREDEIQMLTNPANGEAFKTVENMANARIQKLLLGRVKTGDLSSSSRAAQEVDEVTRQERIRAYLNLLGVAVQHAVDAVLAVNAAYGKEIHAPAGVWFEFDKETIVDKTRAERDQIYAAMGLSLTEDYFVNVLGYEPEHFTLHPAAAPNTAAALSLSLAENGAPALGKPYDTDTALMQPKMQAVMAALAEAEDFDDFQTALAELDLSAGDLNIVDQLVNQACRQAADDLSQDGAQ
ncbi:phage portal protein family protein [Neisseria perflava]|uniref:phage portal protein family protein n=1 Tax=Neisseria perflava TaxID=33053 RepID=UPI0020A1A79D|nr:DUF935 family protein [Neisseria perflava]MCP1659332.1 hypothetical protein [Neisseria perflava]